MRTSRIEMGDILSQAPWSLRKDLVATTLLAVLRGREPVFAQAAISPMRVAFA